MLTKTFSLFLDDSLYRGFSMYFVQLLLFGLLEGTELANRYPTRGKNCGRVGNDSGGDGEVEGVGKYR